MFSLTRFNRRLYSSIAELHKQLSHEPSFQGKQKLLQTIPIAFEKFSSSDENGELVHDIVKTVQNHAALSKDDKVDLINQFMIHGLPHDYSLYFTVKKGSHSWTTDSLAKLIEANPGRVDQGWDLYKKYIDGSNINSDAADSLLYQILLEKLLFGEKVEIRDSDIEMSVNRLARAIYVSTKVDNVTLESSVEIIRLAIQYKCIPTLYWSGVSNEQILKVISGNEFEVDDESYVQLFNKVFRESPELVDKESICKALTRVESARNGQDTGEVDNGNISEVKRVLRAEGVAISDHSVIAIPEMASSLADSILSYIRTNNLDLDKSAESLLVRIKLMEVYGMDRNDIQEALAKFHDYQAHEKFGIELVQHKLIAAFCYKAVEQHNEHYLKIAHTLMTMEDIPIKVLSVLILARSEFDDESALELYNEYINSVPKNINSVTKRSGSGLLTEAMMLGSLYNKDREFASLLFEMAQKNNIVSDEYEATTLKKLFKVYGDAFAEDNWEIAHAELKKYVLQAIRR
ncbi:MIOREX complex component 12 [[Candida] railenensis]|uniref:MIOREX complex component 12 n=1 Tax=[Candida] railenensis TaxID=45579 RepID=A0A9P0QQX8_9ASCO|nr:MIOREX complex component 12 [[Candida] railenensis]